MPATYLGALVLSLLVVGGQVQTVGAITLGGQGEYLRPVPPDPFSLGCAIAYATQPLDFIQGDLRIVVAQTTTQAIVQATFSSTDGLDTCIVARVCVGTGSPSVGWRGEGPCLNAASLAGSWRLLPNSGGGYHFEEVIVTILLEDEVMRGDVSIP